MKRIKKYTVIKLSIICLVILCTSLSANNLLASQNRLSGRILLQVQEKGEAWYVNPVNEKRYFLGRPDDAFALMRELGLGISEESYNKFKNKNDKIPSGLSGKILLRVKSKGEAYYVNPLDLKLYYLGRPADAFRVMRELGLGITNVDLAKIAVERANETNLIVKPIVEKTEAKTENNQEDRNTPVRETHTFVGSGTYDFGEGDALIDNVNNMKFVQSGIYEEYGSQWLIFKIYDAKTGAYFDKIQPYLDPETLNTGKSPTSRMIYSYHAGKLPIYFFNLRAKNPDGSYKVSFDFYLNSVLGDKAVGNKKILVMPVYFDDEYEVFDQYPLYRDTFLKPALTEIQAYLKVKQLEFMNKEIMTIDFTVADAIKLGKIDDYLFHEQIDHYNDRKMMIKNNTPYNPDDFDDIAFLFITEKYPEKAYLNTAQYDQAVITTHLSPVTNYELNTPVLIHQLRNTITNGLLHEILHIFGMSDMNGGMKFLFYEAEIFNEKEVIKTERRKDYSIFEQTGIFQMIDETIAHEIGWCDENSNGIFDAKEFYANKEK